MRDCVEALEPLGLPERLSPSPSASKIPVLDNLLGRRESGPPVWVVGPEELVSMLRPLLPVDLEHVEAPEALVQAAAQAAVQRVIVCNRPEQEDASYAAVVAALRAAGQQNARVERWFGDVVTDALADRPPEQGPFPAVAPDWSAYRPYIVLCTGRSGSSHLCDLLTNTGVCGYPKEHLRDPQVFCLRNGLVDLGALLARLLVSHSTPNRVFGTKLISRYVLEMLKDVDPAQLELPADMPVVYLSRRDKVAQAASIVRAKKTGRWHLREGRKAPPECVELTPAEVADAVAEYHQNLQRQHELDTLAAELFQPEQVLQITYEDLVADPRGVLARVMAHIGVETGDGEVPLASEHRKIPAKDRIYDQLREALGQ